MTLRTITYDPAQYKLVPVEPQREMVLAGKHTIKGAETTFEGILAAMAYKSMLAAVPDTLPGVIEHSGEPVAWVTEADVNDFGKGQGESVFLFERTSKCRIPLFTHPAPAQLVERQELSDAEIADIWSLHARSFVGYTLRNHVLNFARSLIAKDRGQA